MDRPVKWAAPALGDLNEIAEYIARDSPRYAAAFVMNVLQAARSLARFAHRSRQVPEIGRDDIREIFVSRYRLIFQARDDHIRILAVIHGARDLSGWPKMLE